MRKFIDRMMLAWYLVMFMLIGAMLAYDFKGFSRAFREIFYSPFIYMILIGPITLLLLLTLISSIVYLIVKPFINLLSRK